MIMPATSTVPAAPALVSFTGRNGDFRRLVVRGAVLELVTFGFYRFWLTTDTRRHLWSHTEIAGDALEYTGRGRELLFGFLIALAVLGPIFLVYFLIGLEAERIKAFASLPLYLFLFAFGQFAAYRARRYRLTRTVWRGVRFWMTGSGWSYAWRSMLWGLLLVPSIGLAYPWRTAALERFKLRHTLYGNLPGRLDATGGQLFGRIWWIWLLGLLPFLLFAGGLVANLFASHPPAAAIVAMLLGTALLIALPFLHAIRRAREWAWWAGGIRFGSVTVTCDLRSGSLIGVYWALIGFSALVFFAFAAVAGGLTAVLVAGMHVRGPVSVGQVPIWGMAAYAVSYLLLGVALGVLARIYTLQRVWQRVVRACAVINIEGAADVTAAGELVSGFGEGLADGLDFGF
ncbi:MAG TPA: DUF898 family protein [Stellaceae bacterium]|nr:DUF898 family protein [Stellaceae bacterium]